MPDDSKDAREDRVQSNNFYLLREKASHITKAARSATIANVLAPLLCIPAFKDEVKPMHLGIWLTYMFVAVVVRTWIVFKLKFKSEEIINPQQNLTRMTLTLGSMGIGWGMGWVLMAPDLLMINRVIYVYMITAALMGSMFAYSVHKPTFYAFTLPIMIPSLTTTLWSVDLFPWTFSVGMATVYMVVLGISTGGPATLPHVLKAMGRLPCPMVVAQHMPPMFTSGFASHLRNETGLNVLESTEAMELKPGMVVIVKGGTDVVVREPFPGKLMLYEKTDPNANIHPNADVLFRSAASTSCPVVSVIMTGMGSDGMQGAKELVARKNSAVLVQEPQTCIVDGMPSSAINAGLASAVLAPKELGLRLSRLCTTRPVSSFNNPSV